MPSCKKKLTPFKFEAELPNWQLRRFSTRENPSFSSRAMSTLTLSLYPPNPPIHFSCPRSRQRSHPPQLLIQTLPKSPILQPVVGKPVCFSAPKTHQYLASGFLGAGLVLLLVDPASAAVELPFLGGEPSNALSLPTWAVHVSSVAEWVAAMTLVWKYGQKPGFEAWKGLSWGMVPLLGGAMCACTWHFFYNSQSLEVLVALQAALTVVGNATMCLAAYRIYKAQEHSDAS